MGRGQRVNVAGGLYHVIQRGNNRQTIFFNYEDRRAFLNRLERCAAACACDVHAYCLMDNHLHLLVRTSRANVSHFGQRLFGGHTLWANRLHRRVGHLFQGRFTSTLVAEDPYLLQVSRYIHLNPVKARMVAKPEEYPWSSMRAYLPGRRASDWVSTEATLAYFGGSRQRYVAFVHEGMARSGQGRQDTQAFAGGGDMPLVEQAMESAAAERREGSAEASVQEILAEVALAHGVSVEVLQHKYARESQIVAAKGGLANLLRQRTTLTLQEIGAVLGGISAPAVARHLRIPQAAHASQLIMNA